MSARPLVLVLGIIALASMTSAPGMGCRSAVQVFAYVGAFFVLRHILERDL